MAKHAPDLGLARDEALTRLWQAAAQGLPIPSECFVHLPSEEFARKLQCVAAWNNHGPTAVALSVPGHRLEPLFQRLEPAFVLAYALSRGSVDAATALLEAGVDMNAEVDRINGNALGWAVRGGHVSAVALLINAKADIDFVGWAGETPINHAAKGGDAVVDMLIAAKADVNRAIVYGETPLHHAMWADDVAIIVRLLCAKASVNATASRGETVLHRGAREAAVVQVLLAAKADVHAVDARGRGVLWHAALGGEVRAVAKLVRAKADVHAVDAAGDTAIHMAAFVGKHVGVAAFLVAAKSDVNRANRAGATPLLTALHKNATDAMVQLLVDAKARVEKSAPVHAFGRVDRYIYTRFGVQARSSV
jgi:ankyrin repeat protein